MKIKKGVILAGLDIKMRPALIIADRIWKGYNQELVVTSGLEGTHSARSLHYYGLALDFRTRYFSEQEAYKVREELENELEVYEGAYNSYDVVREATHIHIECDKNLKYVL